MLKLRLMLEASNESKSYEFLVPQGTVSVFNRLKTDWHSPFWVGGEAYGRTQTAVEKQWDWRCCIYLVIITARGMGGDGGGGCQDAGFGKVESHFVPAETTHQSCFRGRMKKYWGCKEAVGNARYCIPKNKVTHPTKVSTTNVRREEEVHVEQGQI